MKEISVLLHGSNARKAIYFTKNAFGKKAEKSIEIRVNMNYPP